MQIPYYFFNPSLSNSECKISGPSYYGDMVTERMICAYNQGKGTCYGDSGGPLASKVRSSYVLVGNMIKKAQLNMCTCLCLSVCPSQN